MAPRNSTPNLVFYLRQCYNHTLRGSKHDFELNFQPKKSTQKARKKKIGFFFPFFFSFEKCSVPGGAFLGLFGEDEEYFA